MKIRCICYTFPRFVSQTILMVKVICNGSISCHIIKQHEIVLISIKIIISGVAARARDETSSMLENIIVIFPNISEVELYVDK